MKFIDVTGDIPPIELPAEAMKFNGVWLEERVPGYRTLNVSGREMLQADVKDRTIGLIDGSEYLGKRYPARKITVTYQLAANSDTEFREAFNTLNALLDASQVQVIFNDEPDKYFTATKTSHTDPDPGRNVVTGQIELYCSDPFKYSLAEKEFDMKDNAMTITNGGTVAVPIRFEITHSKENGYIGIASETGVMEFGKREETDGKTYSRMEHLLNIDNFYNAKDDTTGTDAMHPGYGHAGSLSKQSRFGLDYLMLASEGTRTGLASGGMRTLTIPVDSNGNKGAKNWYCWAKVCFYANLMGQTGEMSLSFLTEDNQLIAGCNWYKWDASGNTGCYQMVVHGPMDQQGHVNGREIQRQITYQCNHLHSQNPWYYPWGFWDLRKEGPKITFFYWGSYYTYYVPEIENMVCTKIQVTCRSDFGRVGNQQLYCAGFTAIDFYKNDVEKWMDVPNRFPENSTCTVDGANSKFYVNGMPRQQDEVLGTEYFKASPGSNDIKFNFSSFCSPAPTVKAYIREAWI